MRLNTVKHEDSRRILTEWISDIPVKRCKVLEVKEKSVLGKHYHNDSDNIFYMVRGKGSYILRSSTTDFYERDWLYEGDCLFVPRGIIHTFELYPGTILLEAATEPYNKNDEIQATE